MGLAGVHLFLFARWITSGCTCRRAASRRGALLLEPGWSCDARLAGPAALLIIVSLIANTTNRGGLVVRALLDRRKYPTGKKISAKEFRALKIEKDVSHGEWNYVIRPREKAG